MSVHEALGSGAATLGIRPRGGVSHVRGVGEPALLRCTLGQFLDDAAARGGDREAVVFSDTRWSWNDLARETNRLAATFVGMGLTKGDRLGIWGPNRPEWLLTQLASARIGVILVNINPAYRLGELEHALVHSGCKAIVAAEAFKTSDYLGMLGTLAPELATSAPGALRAARVPDLRFVLRMGAEATPGMANFAEMLAKHGDTPANVARAQALAATLDPDEAINIQFTSGTTGLPKGATLTHANLANNGRFIARAMRLGEDDKLCIPVPLYHCFGMVLGVLACVSAGTTMLFPGEGFEPTETLAMVAREGATALHGVPTMFAAMLEVPDFGAYNLASLRTGIMAGAPCPIAIMRRVANDMHMSEITIAYGMTETSPVSFQSSVEDPLERRVSSVGRVHPHVETRIVDPETGKVMPVGEKGELHTKGYSVMRGYWGDEARTRDAVVDGWMHTGDLAVMDEEGYCNIVGRVKDMIIRGGENVYPREVEEHLYRCSGVAEAQVFGLPDPRWGEIVCAWIIRRAGEPCDEAAVRAFCKEQIAHYKAPQHIRFVEAFPMTVTGKPQKFLMRATMVAALGLTEPETA